MSEPNGSCWSCRTSIAALDAFCPACGAVQPPRAASMFAILGMPVQFEVDAAELERRYFAEQRRFHPDRFTGKPERERQFSMQHSTNVNEAYRVLGDPVRRAEHLLLLAGQPARTVEETVRDPVILMRALEMREALAEAQSRAEIDGVLKAAKGEALACAAELTKAFANADLQCARTLTLQLTYLQKFIEEARERRTRVVGGQSAGAHS